VQKKLKPPVYIRYGEIPVEEFLSMVPLTRDSGIPTKREMFGKIAKFTSPRYLVYATKGVICPCCGRSGSFFALERSKAQQTEKCHFNLYGVDSKTGEEFMMTIDHIKPKARGGLDILENKQPMCFSCNNKKGDKLKT